MNIRGIFSILMLYYFLTAYMLNAQENLVYNGSFEENCICQYNFYIDTFACEGWWSPNDATPDYYNKCMNDHINSYHDYYKLHYEPKTGNGFIGLALIGVKYFWMEHIQSQLLEPLEAGKRYKVSFWVRLAHKYSDYATYNIGLYFSKDPDFVGKKYNVSSYLRYMTPELRAHIKNPGGNFITDTNWVEISGIYTAQGGEQYITIGMFWDDTPAVVKALNRCKKNNNLFNREYLSNAFKNNLLIENKYIDEIFVKKFFKKSISEFKHESKVPYYLIDDVSVVKLEE
jgi:hypothetical protein